jgi:hypothetical protein
MSPADADSVLGDAIAEIASGNLDGARADLRKLASNQSTPQPERNWAYFYSALASLLAGDSAAALGELKTVNQAGLYSTAPEDQEWANFFVETSRVVLDGKPIPASIRNLYPRSDEAFALLLFGIWDWEAKAAFGDSAGLLKAFLASRTRDEWLKSLRPVAERYVHDWELIRPIESAFEAGKSPPDAAALRASIAAARGNLQTGTRASERLDVLEKRLSMPSVAK